MKKVLPLLTVILVVLITGCPSKVKYPPRDITKPEIKQENTLFEEDEETKITVLKTNNKKYLSKKGYSVWTKKYINETKEFQDFSVSVKKDLGKSDAGYGICFCQCTLEDNTNFMMTVLINVNGYYEIGSVYNGSYKTIDNIWQQTSWLEKGFEQYNKLTVKYNSDSESFELYINNQFVTEFKNPEVKQDYTDTWNGFVAVLAPNENFDNSYVQVTYKRED